MTIFLRSFFSGFVSSLSTKKISKTHKKKLNSVFTGLMFTLALLAVPTAMGIPSTLFCHVAVKPHTGFVCCFFCLPSEPSVSTREFGESSQNSLTVTKH